MAAATAVLQSEPRHMRRCQPCQMQSLFLHPPQICLAFRQRRAHRGPHQSNSNPIGSNVGRSISNGALCGKSTTTSRSRSSRWGLCQRLRRVAAKLLGLQQAAPRWRPQGFQVGNRTHSFWPPVCRHLPVVSLAGQWLAAAQLCICDPPGAAWQDCLAWAARGLPLWVLPPLVSVRQWGSAPLYVASSQNPWRRTFIASCWGSERFGQPAMFVDQPNLRYHMKMRKRTLQL